MKTKSNPHLVVQSNQFLNFRHTLSLAEARVFLSMVAQIEKDDEDFKTYRIEVKQFVDLLGLKGKGNYTILREVAEGLSQKQFKQLQPDGSFLVIGYISSAQYIAGHSYVELSFDPKLKPFLLGLKEAFTQYDIRIILSLRSINVVRLYELLKQYERIKYREFDVDVLKYTLNLDKKYPRYCDFKADVLEVAKRDLAKSTDISFDYKEIRQGRRVVRIRFNIYSQNAGPEELSLPEGSQDHEINLTPVIIVESLKPQIKNLFNEIDPSLTENEITIFIENLNADETNLLDVLMYVRQEKQKGIQIRSLLAYIQSGIKTRLGKGISQKQTNLNKDAEEKKRIDKQNREISKWYEFEFPSYLSTYYENLGSDASDPDKFAFIDYINAEIKERPSLKTMYYDGAGKVKQQQMRLAMGMHIFKISGKEEIDVFIDWVAKAKRVTIKYLNGKWQQLNQAPF